MAKSRSKKKPAKKSKPRLDCGDLEGVDKQMKNIRKSLSDLPDDEDWTEKELEALEDVRHSCLVLSLEIEYTIRAHEENTKDAD